MRALYFCTSVATLTPPKLPFCHLSSPFLLQRLRFSVQSSKILGFTQRRPIVVSSTKATMASTPSDTDDNEPKIKPFSVLFVCLGNICRSPAAEGIFRNIVKTRGLDSRFNIDSAGTINYHEGNQADPRMRGASKRRGIPITSISRPIKTSDFVDFDLILAMDRQNREDILEAFERWRHRESLPADGANKVKLMCSYCKKHTEKEVPDPYYGGDQGFEQVLDLLEDACQSLLESIIQENPQIMGS